MPRSTFSGIGYDVHAFAEGRPLFLGGIEVPHAKGLEGHSDADVLIHAIADALLGTIAAADIGHHFPNTDASIAGIRSTDILSRVVDILDGHSARIINVDATLIAEAPKIAPHLEEDACAARRVPAPAGRPGEHQGDHQREDGFPRPRRGHRGAGDCQRRTRRSQCGT